MNASKNISDKRFSAENLDFNSLLDQWVSSVPLFSSQYGATDSISYCVDNIVSSPSKYPCYGDFTTCAVWRTYGPWWDKLCNPKLLPSRKTANFISEDFVDLVFGTAVWPTRVRIYETYHPGTVVRILAADMAPDELKGAVDRVRWFVLWSAEPQTGLPGEARIFSPPLAQCPFSTKMIRLELNQQHCEYYTELDGVELSGYRHQRKGYKLCKHRAEADLVTTTASPQTNTADPQEVTVCVECGGYESGTGCVLCAGCVDLKVESVLSLSCCSCLYSNKQPATSSSPPPLPPPTSSSPPPTSMERITKGIAELHVQTGLTDALDESDNSHFDLLPDEVIQHILSYLDLHTLAALSSASQLFYKHCSDPLQYVNLDLQPYWPQVTDEALEGLAGRCRYVQTLNLSWCGAYNHITPAGFATFVEGVGRDLRCLRLASCVFLTDDCLTTIVTHLPQLNILDVQNCERLNTLSQLTALRHLTSLNLYRTNITSSVLTECIKNNPGLEELNIGSCHRLDKCDDIAEVLAEHCKQLRLLDCWRSRSLSHVGLLSLLEGCALLEQLDLGWCGHISPTSGCFRALAKSCKYLRKIFLTANRSVSDSDIMAFSEHLPNLEQLDFLGNNRISSAAVKSLLEGCKKLYFLDLSFCNNVEDEAVMQLRHDYPHCDIKRSFQDE